MTASTIDYYRLRHVLDKAGDALRLYADGVSAVKPDKLHALADEADELHGLVEDGAEITGRDD